MQFSELGLSDKVLAAVDAAGYREPTEIQEQAIPHVVAGRDVLGIAQTGTGKTAGFVLPMLTKLEAGRARARIPRTLILEPTRELAAQVEENFNKYGINHPRLTVALLIGGMSFDEQDRKLERGADVLIATPGRMLDHFERGKLLLTGVEIVVIDEADRMLDMGFIPDIERIMKLVTGRHQTLLFSATMPPQIQHLADAFMTDPVRVEVARAATTAKTVAQHIVATGSEDYEKRELLRELIRGAEDMKNAIVFCNRKRDVATLLRSLQRHDFNAGALHGDMDQSARMATLDAFRKGSLAILVASDVAARGLDIPDVSHVYNFDVPIHAEDYVHRIGRTGRAGRSGTSVTLVAPEDAKAWAAIERLTGDSVPWIGEPLDPEAIAHAPKRRRGGRGEGRTGEGRTGGRERSGHDARGHEPKSRERRSRDDGARGPVERTQGEPSQAERGPRREARGSGDRPAARTETRRDDDARGEGGRGNRRGNEPRERTAQSAADRFRPQPERGRRFKDDDDERPVVGLGDHMPAFLMRPARGDGPTGAE